MQCGILGQKEDINEKVAEIHIKSGVLLIVMSQYWFLGFDNCIKVM